VSYGGSLLLVVGAHGTILRSTNYGATWAAAVSNTTVDLHGCSAYAGDCLACGDSGTILKSTDNGITWGKQASPTVKPLYGIIALNGVQYFAAGANGTMLETKDGGGIVSSVASQPAALPSRFALEQNYPNPFNPSTTIRFTLPGRSRVTLSVFNTLGQVVTTLVDRVEDAGDHEVKFDGGNLASGVYIYRLQAGGDAVSRKFVMIR
jgi:hypothetical protein